MSLQKTRRRRFGDILVSDGLLNPDQLASALRDQAQTGDTLGDTLLRLGLVSEGDIVRTICVQYQLPFISPSNYELDGQLLEKLPVEFMYRYRILPLGRIGSMVIVALGEIPPENVELELGSTLEGELAFYFASVKEIESLLVTRFSLSQDQVYSFDSNRRRPPPATQTGRASAPAPETPTSLLDALDSSWESIFDEADSNVKGQSS
ncbi:MAG: hypothetical protein AB7O52_08080 [Planctomycetota bacterium]